MEEIIQRQQYELAFHLLPSFTETEAEEKRREIEELISKNDGLISRYSEIKKIKLAYPIKKERFSNFGYIEFFAPKTTIERINKNLRTNENILRHLVVKKEKERTVKPKPAKLAAPMPETPRVSDEASGKETEEKGKKTEELDKKIEEILQKI